NMEEAYKFVHHHLVYKRAKDKIFGYDVDWAFLLNLAKECGVDWLEYLELYNRSVDVGACDTAWESLRLYLEKCGENCMNDEDMQITYRRLYDRALSTFPTPPDFRVAFEVAERIFGEGLRLQKDVLDSISGDDVSFANTRLFFRLLFRYRGNGGSVLKYFLE
ncbi:hypothetical protein KJ764_06050, partial [Patescibacteria group bacterium]|nr:hypothetical protein [Patescibacteria group bacterium]